MARDLDFKSRPNAPSPQKPALPIESSLVHASRAKTRRIWLWFLAILIVLLVMGIFVWWDYNQAHHVSNTPTKSISQVSTTKVSSSQESNIPNIIVYDGGAGTTTTSNAVNQIQQAGYYVQNLGTSLYQYKNQSYIFYQPTYQSDAQKIQRLLGSNNVTLQVNNGPDPYKIMIILGSQN